MTDSVALIGVKGGPAIRPGSHMPTSSLLRLGGYNILVDAGLGVTRGICDQGVSLTEIDLIVITHLHSDHYLELGPLIHTAWTAGLNKPIPILGPDGLSAYWDSFQKAMAFDIDLRIRDEGRCAFSTLADLRVLSDAMEFGSVRINAMRNVHPPIADSFALRFEVGDKSVVLSGDTAYMPEMVGFAKDADLLVHEAMLRDGVDALCARMTNGDERLREHILRSHTDATDVGRIARDAGVKALALHHFVPDGDPDFTDADWTAAVRKYWSGPLFLGKDGMVISLDQ
ncbi:MBL fold metallo-hydrolase [Cognatiyoonia sp. IB215182]|uniref:MBL fold metallo-hydrolase n=1 Tax=Cognatiyoonia sp. IB215182 TaxID=3097353 RepID=UPI002A166865|nr:MBL fold metallo-hydrolase [Cognatiyoonia sp. IB215182]MDX8350798.1 MBL fold metallo-hydrolase [Cognatiyoonia sp. IB215182]